MGAEWPGSHRAISCSKLFSAPSIPWRLLQTHRPGLRGPPAGLTTPDPSTLMGPDLWKQAGSGIPGLPAPAEWHSAMHPGHQRPNVTLPLAVLVSEQDKRPPLFWSSGFPGGHRGNTTTGSAGRSGRGLEHPGSGTTGTGFLFPLAPSLLLPTTRGLSLC